MENGAHFSGEGHLIEGQIEGDTNKTIIPVVVDSSGHLIVSASITPSGTQNVNLIQVSGSAITEGQKAMAASIPVVIASDQSAIPVTGTITTSPNVNVHDSAGNPINSTGTSLNVDVTNTVPVTLTSTTITGNVTVVQPTGTNLHVVVDGTSPISGTVTANQGTANTTANKWPIEIVDSSGTNVATVSATGAVKVDGSAVTQPVNGTITANAGTGNFTVVQATAANLNATVTGTVTTTPPANASTNLTQVAGTALGATGVAAYGTAPAAVNVPGVNAFITNTPAVTLTSTTITGTVAVTESGTWTVQPGNTANTTPWLVTQSPATSGGVSANVQQALTSSALVKGSAGQKYGYEIFNPNIATVYVFFYNTTSAPTIGSTTNLITQMGIPAGSGAVFNHTIGIAFSTGIYVAVSTSATSAAAPSTGITITTLYN